MTGAVIAWATWFLRAVLVAAIVGAFVQCVRGVLP